MVKNKAVVHNKYIPIFDQSIDSNVLNTTPNHSFSQLLHEANTSIHQVNQLVQSQDLTSLQIDGSISYEPETTKTSDTIK